MTTNEVQAIMRDTARAVAESVTDVLDGEWGERRWERIVVNHETLLDRADGQASTMAFAVARGGEGGAHELVDFRLSRAARDGLKRLHAAMAAREGEHWAVCDLTIEADGAYDYRFADESALHRLGPAGQARDTRFDGYLERYLLELKGAGT
jgi:hypothetical protein